MNCCSNDATVDKKSYIIMDTLSNKAYINERPILVEKFDSTYKH